MGDVLQLLGIGLVVGWAGGTLGVGGGFILVPVLYTVMGWPMLSAVATSHFCGLAVSVAASGTYAQAGLIDWRLGVIIESAAVAGAAAGASLAAWISSPLLAVLFCLVAALAAVRMWWTPRVAGSVEVARRRRRYLWGLPAMFLVGAVSAILGLGGGLFMVPILTILMGMPMREAVATSVFMVGFNAATSAAVYYMQGQVAVVPTAILATAVICGAFIGSSMARHLPVKVLRRAFAALLLFLAVRLAWRALG
jgi:uncharacterized membrane protein YfcA